MRDVFASPNELTWWTALADMKEAGCEIRLIDGELFSVKRLSPMADPAAFAAACLANDWRGMRTKGTNPTTWDTGDPQTLALLVERNHDYPDADALGGMIAD